MRIKLNTKILRKFLSIENENYPKDVSSDKMRINQAVKIDNGQNQELKYGRAGSNMPPFKTEIRNV